jgi:hypothetical protein
MVIRHVGSLFEGRCVRSFKITDWARALPKNTDYDLRSFGVHTRNTPRFALVALVIAKVINWLVKYHPDESLVTPVVLQRNCRAGCGTVF